MTLRDQSVNMEFSVTELLILFGALLALRRTDRTVADLVIRINAELDKHTPEEIGGRSV